MKKVSLIGAGGLAREFMSLLLQSGCQIEYLYDGNIIRNGNIESYGDYYTVSNNFRRDSMHVIAVGYPETKRKIIDSIPHTIKWYPAIFHKLCNIGDNVYVGEGSVVCPFTSMTSDVTIGGLATINTGVTIGHDVKIGSMFHASPGAVISGNVIIGNRVFMGANSCIKEKIMVCSDVIIGAGAVVVDNISEPGVYAGNPAYKIR